MSLDLLFLNDSLLDTHLVNFYLYSCFTAGPGLVAFNIFNVSHIILLLPLCIFIIYFGFHQLKEKTPSSTISHYDSFTYHMVSIEMLGIGGRILCLCANCMENKDFLNVGINVFLFTWYGQLSFHILTCVERYLAVVHPITYLDLRKEKWVRIRNITIVCVWLLSLVGIVFEAVVNTFFLDICVLILSLTSISFCSLSVICVLVRSGPGKPGDGRVRVDQSKRRALYTIMIILGVLWLRISFCLIWIAVEMAGIGIRCVLMTYGIWINLPCSLALPLLFLQRAVKVGCCKKIRSFVEHTP